MSTHLSVKRRSRGAMIAVLTCASAAASTVVPSDAAAQWSTAYEQYYLPGAFNWTFRKTYPGADRLFAAFDYGHAILYERLYNEPDADPSVLEETEYRFITTKLLVSPPRLPLVESAIEVEYAKLAPEAKMMFDWAHLLHRQIYDVLASEEMSAADKDAKIQELLRYYKTRPDLAFSSVPKSMDLMEGQPYSLAFRQRYPKFNGLIWAYHWLQVGLYEPLVTASSLDGRQVGVTAAVARFRQMLENAPEHMPRMMPMTAAVAPVFTQRYPEAAIIFDNLHSMHDVVSDILANAKVPRDQKRAEILRAAGRYRDATSFTTTAAEWIDMAKMMGLENMGGPAVGFLPGWATPTIARGTPAAEAMKSMSHGAAPGMAAMPAMPGMNHPAARPAPDTTHAAMPGMTMGDGGNSGAMTDAMMNLLMRLTSDAVVRERIAVDTAFRRTLTEMIDQMPEEHRAHMRGMLPPATTSVQAAGASTPAGTTPSPPGHTMKPTPKKVPSKTPAKKAPADSMAGMKGMDHSKMPGMKKAPADSGKPKP